MKGLLKFAYANWILIAIIVVGCFFRLYKFGEIPAGINQDEAQVAYETISLITNQSDRWGNHLPIYFLSWGSGQNVLLSYLNIPVFLIAGFTPITLRFFPMLFGMLTIPLIYLVVLKLAPNKKLPALLAALLVACSPFFIMQSRWALEGNIMPFLLLLGTYLAMKFLESHKQKTAKWWALAAAITLALACYVYILALPLALTVFLTVLFLYFREHHKLSRLMLIWLAIFLVLVSPLILLFVKNNIVKAELPGENLLPFSIPLFTTNRLDQQNVAGIKAAIDWDLRLFKSGLNDLSSYNAIPEYPPILQAIFLWPLFGLGMLRLLKNSNTNTKILWMSLCVGTIFFAGLSLKTYLSTNRFNGLLLPLIIIVAFGIEVLIKYLHRLQGLKKIALLLILISFLTYSAFMNLSFFNYYFSNQEETKNRDQKVWAFYPKLSENLERIKTQAGNNPIYLSQDIRLGYIFVLLSEKLTPQSFINEADIVNRVQVNRIRNFYFLPEALPKAAREVYFIASINKPEFCKSEINIKVVDGYLLGSCLL